MSVGWAFVAAFVALGVIAIGLACRVSGNISREEDQDRWDEK